MKRATAWVAWMAVVSVLNAAPAARHANSGGKPAREWPVYGGGPAQDHYSPLAQINRRNVSQLRVAWTYDSGEKGGMETNPIIVGSVLYALTPSQKVIALNAASGKLLWKFDSGLDGRQPDRGVAYWSDGHGSRIFAGVMNYLYALDAATGKPVASFGEGGRIDLRKGLRGDYRLQSIALTSPGIIYRDLIIVGGRNPESTPAPPGDIRAYDVRSGELRWRFHTIPHPGEPGYDTWPAEAWKHAGAANNWAGMALDAQRGIVYIPTGSAVPDFYGGKRVGKDLFADTLLALDAKTGRLLWYFQGVHHDLWDRDFPAPPALVTVEREGKAVDAVAQTTKQGWLFIFNRATGKPLFPIEEKPFPPSDVPGEVASATQPVPLEPAPYTPEVLREGMLTQRTPEAHAWALEQFRKSQGRGPFAPLGVGQSTIVYPGLDGGAEWGGPAIDPRAAVLYVNANDVGTIVGLMKNDPRAGMGRETYDSQCAGCHGANRAGSPPEFPSLVHIGNRLTGQQIADTVHEGRGRMPAFPNLQGGTLAALIGYLETGREDSAQSEGRRAEWDSFAVPGNSAGEAVPPPVTPSSPDWMAYQLSMLKGFNAPDGYPATTPPWGTLSAIDLNTGKYLWQVPLGEYPELAAKGMGNTGSENYGGPIVTAGGLVFIGATVFDREFRAFDSRTGRLLWHTVLPYSGLATPSTYMARGKQYVVIAAGGGKAESSPGGKMDTGGMYIAFALRQARGREGRHRVPARAEGRINTTAGLFR